MKFRAKVLLAGKTATGVEVPARVVLASPIANGKTPETRQRNLEKAMKMLREGRIT